MKSRSLTTTEAGEMTEEDERLEPIHPGEILDMEFLQDYGITQYRLAVSIGVPPGRINEIIHGRRGISADTAMRLSKYFGNSVQFWLNLQNHYDVDVASRKAGAEIAAIVPLEHAG